MFINRNRTETEIETDGFQIHSKTPSEEVYYVDHYNAVLTAVTVQINILVWERKYSARIYHTNIPYKYSTQIFYIHIGPK